MGINAIYYVLIAVLMAFLVSSSIKVGAECGNYLIGVLFGWLVLPISLVYIAIMYNRIVIKKCGKNSLLKFIIYTMRYIFATILVYPLLHTISSMEVNWFITRFGDPKAIQSRDTVKYQENAGLKLEEIVLAL